MSDSSDDVLGVNITFGDPVSLEQMRLQDRLQDVIRNKDIDNALYGESWAIIDNTLVISFEDARPLWLENVLATIDEDGNTPDVDPVTEAHSLIDDQLLAIPQALNRLRHEVGTIEAVREMRELSKHLAAIKADLPGRHASAHVLTTALRVLVSQQSEPDGDLHGLTDLDEIASAIIKWLPTYMARVEA